MRWVHYHHCPQLLPFSQRSAPASAHHTTDCCLGRRPGRHTRRAANMAAAQLYTALHNCTAQYRTSSQVVVRGGVGCWWPLPPSALVVLPRHLRFLGTGTASPSLTTPAAPLTNLIINFCPGLFCTRNFIKSCLFQKVKMSSTKSRL